MNLTKEDTEALFELIDEWECANERSTPTVDTRNRESVHILPDCFYGIVNNFDYNKDNDGWTDVFVIVDNYYGGFDNCCNDETGEICVNAINFHPDFQFDVWTPSDGPINR